MSQGSPTRPIGRVLAAAAALALLAPAPTRAQESCELTEVVAPDAGPDDRFGHAVAALDEWLFVGAPFQGGAGFRAGCVYVFHRDGLVWTWHSTLRGADTASGHWFGNSLSASGDALIVGARRASKPRDTCGAAYIFRLVGDQWLQEARLTAPDAATGDEFGLRVAIDGDQAAVGAPYRDGIGIDSGAAYVFGRSDGDWSCEAMLLPSNPQAHDHFGLGISIDAGRILVGSPQGNGQVPDSGAAYLFSLAGGDWAERCRFYADTPTENDQFGNSVALVGDLAVVGSRLDDRGGLNAGRAFVYRESGGVWTLESPLIAPDASAGDEFGIAVAAQPDMVVIGSYLDSDGDNGSAYEFRRIGGAWVLDTKFKSSDAAAGDQFGGAVALRGDFAYTGARLDDTAGPDAGAVYVHSAAPVCRADLDQDGLTSIFDFLSYQNLFIAGDKIANYDCDAKLDLFDFLAFTNVFVSGCK